MPARPATDTGHATFRVPRRRIPTATGPAGSPSLAGTTTGETTVTKSQVQRGGQAVAEVRQKTLATSLPLTTAYILAGCPSEQVRGAMGSAVADSPINSYSSPKPHVLQIGEALIRTTLGTRLATRPLTRRGETTTQKEPTRNTTGGTKHITTASRTTVLATKRGHVLSYATVCGKIAVTLTATQVGSPVDGGTGLRTDGARTT